MADIKVGQADITRGEEILLSLIYPTRPEDMSVDQAAQFSLAAHEQAEFSVERGKGRIKRESVGDVSVTYEDSDVRAVDVLGERISPVAIARLQRCGLLCRWI